MAVLQSWAINFIAAASHKLGLRAVAQRGSSKGGGGGEVVEGKKTKPHLIRRLREEQRKKGRRGGDLNGQPVKKVVRGN